MEVKSTNIDNVTVLTPVGRVDTVTAKAFEDALMAAVSTNKKIAICFSEVNYMSSAGLRVVLMLGKKITSLNGALVLIDMPDKIFAVFKMSGFDKILKICQSFEEAKEFF
ncbi:MAG: STAS domain-containing protein [Holosporaceae bacterium]|jgi:anti-anti-sigma factor|nr:STAS domain-containing protein [Holosporaceae bacterium]